MNILMLTWLFWPHVGGVERHVEQVSKRLVADGHRVTVFTFKHDRSLPSAEDLGGVQIYRFERKNPERWERKRVIWWFLKNGWLTRWADVIHAHDFYTWDWSFLVLRLIFGGKRVYLTFHGYEQGFPPTARSIKYRRLAEQWTDGNIIIGDYIAKWYGTRYDFVSYGAVEPPGSGQRPFQTRAIFKGRLEEDTGILFYLEALRLLKEHYGVSLPLDIFGDGCLRPQIERMITANGLQAALHGFVGDVERRLEFEPRFAFASSYLSILESMIRRRLVFSVYVNKLKKDYLFSLPGAEDILVIASSPGELAEALARLPGDDTSLVTRLDKAYAFARAQTWDRVADIYLALYERSCNASGGGSR